MIFSVSKRSRRDRIGACERMMQTKENDMCTMIKFMRAASLSIALLGGASVATAIIMPDAAYAGKGNGNGGDNGNGGGSGKGNGGGSDKGKSGASDKAKGKGASGKSGAKNDKASKPRSGGNLLDKLFKGKDQKSKAASKTKKTVKKKQRPAKVKAVAQAKPVKKSVSPKPRGNPLALALGVHPSELGALNAANASPQALENASPNSRVGKLAIYANEVAATQQIEADLAVALETLESLDQPERSVEEIDFATETAEMEKAALEEELARLQSNLDAAGGDDEAIKGEIGNVTDAIAATETEIASLAEERANAEAYAAAENDVEQLEGDLAEQEGVARTALEAAANKEVTDEVEAAVRAMLGLDTVSVEPSEDLEVSELE